ncbi:TonB-dependent siderophore receptor [Paracidovorax avenae]
MHPALAQRVDRTPDAAGPLETTLPDISVTAAPDVGTSLNRLTPTLRETPQSITVIDAERMQEQNLHTLDDVMKQSPGVTVQPYQQLTTGYYARGFKIDSFQQDGVPILMGSTASAPEDMAMYERVEILRGAAGLLSGTGNPSATVNLVPKRPTRRFGGNASLAAGSWNRLRAEADVGGPLNAAGTLRARLVTSDGNRHFFYDVAKQRSANLYGIAELDLAPLTTLNLGMQRQRIRSVPHMSGVPFYADGRDIGLPRSTYLDVDWGRFDWDNTRVFAGLDHRWANGWMLKVSANHLSGDAFMKYAAANGAVDPVTLSGPRLMGAAYDFDNSQSSLDAYATGPVTLWGRRHELMVGANYQKTRTEQFSANLVPAVNTPVNVFHWNPHRVAETGIGPFTSRGPTRTEQSGAYGMGRFSLADPLKLIAGGRISNWQQAAPGASSRIHGQFTPYGGLVLEFDPLWSAYASYARIFQPQSGRSWSGDLIDPVEGTNYEAGVKGELADGRLNVALSVFRIRQKNRAQQDPDHPCVGALCYYIASGEVVSRGVDAEIAGRITRDLSLSGGYTYNATEYVVDATSAGQPFARFVPRHILRLWGNYALPVDGRRWTLGAGVQLQSDFSVVAGGTTLRQGGYGLVNLRLGYRMSPKTTVALNIDNLFDRRYYQSLSSVAWNNRYGEPRSAMVTLRTTF